MRRSANRRSLIKPKAPTPVEKPQVPVQHPQTNPIELAVKQSMGIKLQ